MPRTVTGMGHAAPGGFSPRMWSSRRRAATGSPAPGTRSRCRPAQGKGEMLVHSCSPAARRGTHSSTNPEERSAWRPSAQPLDRPLHDAPPSRTSTPGSVPKTGPRPTSLILCCRSLSFLSARFRSVAWAASSRSTLCRSISIFFQGTCKHGVAIVGRVGCSGRPPTDRRVLSGRRDLPVTPLPPGPAAHLLEDAVGALHQVLVHLAGEQQLGLRAGAE